MFDAEISSLGFFLLLLFFLSFSVFLFLKTIVSDFELINLKDLKISMFLNGLRKKTTKTHLH